MDQLSTRLDFPKRTFTIYASSVSATLNFKIDEIYSRPKNTIFGASVLSILSGTCESVRHIIIATFVVENWIKIVFNIKNNKFNSLVKLQQEKNTSWHHNACLYLKWPWALGVTMDQEYYSYL